MISTILATDLDEHTYHLNTFRKHQHNLDLSKRIQKLILCNMILKCADLNHATKPFKIHCRWADLILKEFALQAVEEANQGFPVNTDPNLAFYAVAAKQISFLDEIVLPLYREFGDYVKETQYVDALLENREIWKRVAESVKSTNLYSVNSLIHLVPSIWRSKELVSKGAQVRSPIVRGLLSNCFSAYAFTVK